MSAMRRILRQRPVSLAGSSALGDVTEPRKGDAPRMTSIRVNADNFARAETHRMFADLQRDAGGVNRLFHNRAPAAIDKQTVIRMNRDTLYSFAIVDISAGATLTLPPAGRRYLSAMVVNEDHYINRVIHEAGTHELT